MTRLAERWVGLARLPRVALGTLPTPVERLDALSARSGAEVWVKRDDQTAALYGGNKVRKLEYLLGEALERGARSVVTVGALGSHHALATSLFGGRQGLEVHAVLSPQPWTEHVEENLRADVAAGARLHPARSAVHALVRATFIAGRLRLRGRCPVLIGHGGSSPIGCVGLVEAGLELATDIETGRLPEPDVVYVALGSGGTAAGLAVGLAACGIPARVRAVRVVPSIVCNRTTLRWLVAGTVERLRRYDARFPDVVDQALAQIDIDDRERGAGYGSASASAGAASEEARAAGLMLDPTYTARAFAALRRDAGAGLRQLFWQTLSSADLAPLAARAPALPAWVRRNGRGR